MTPNDIAVLLTRKRVAVLIIVFILIFVALVLAMNWGQLSMRPLEVIHTLFGQGTKRQELVLFQFRLPRIVLAVLVGAGLAVSGAILQGISRNDLSDPGILGISSGASLAIVLYISYCPIQAGTSPYLLPVLAFAGASVTAVLIYILAYKQGYGLSPTRLVLTGIATGMGISAISILYTLKFRPEQFQFVVEWSAGTLWGADWTFVGALLPWIVLLVPIAIAKAHTLNLLQLHETLSTNLGVPIERERLLLLGIAVALAAASVATGGGIGFVGLVSPHLARRLVGTKHQIMLPVAAGIGGLLVLAADTMARNIVPNTEIPAGVVVSLLGAPYFLYLLMKSKV